MPSRPLVATLDGRPISRAGSAACSERPSAPRLCTATRRRENRGWRRPLRTRHLAAVVLGLVVATAAACERGPQTPSAGPPAANAQAATPSTTTTAIPAPTLDAASPQPPVATTTVESPIADAPPVPDPPSIAAPTPPNPVAFDSLRPFYAASVHDGSLFVFVPGKTATMQRVLGDGGELPRGHRREPKQLQALGTLHVVSTNGAQALPSYDAFGSLLPEEYWSLRYDDAGVGDEPLAMRGEPAPTAVVRVISTPPKPLSARDPLARRAKRMLVQTERREMQAWIAERLNKFSQQDVEGQFAGAPRLVVVCAWAASELEHPNDDVGVYGSAIFTVDDEGKVVRQLASGMLVTATALVDLDGDGSDEILTLDQGYEESGRSLYHVTAKRIQHMEISYDAI